MKALIVNQMEVPHLSRLRIDLILRIKIVDLSIFLYRWHLMAFKLIKMRIVKAAIIPHPIHKNMNNSTQAKQMLR